MKKLVIILLGILSILFMSMASADINTEVTHAYLFENGTTTTTDMGNVGGNDLTNIGATENSFIVGTGHYFVSGENDGAKYEANVYDYFNTSTDEGSFSVWVNCTDNDNSYGAGAYQKGSPIFAVGGTYLSINLYNNDTLVYYTSPGEGWSVGANVEINKIYHIGLTWNSTSMCAYINGTLLGCNNTRTLENLHPAATGQTFWVGRNNGAGGSGLAYFDGSIDELLFYNVSLTPTQMNDIYTKTTAGDGFPFNLLGDTTPPVVTYISPVSTVDVQNFDVSFNATDETAGTLNCSVYDQNVNLIGSDNSITSGIISNISVVGVTEGDTTLNVTCEDENSNFGSDKTAGFFTLDWIPPVTKSMFPIDEYNTSLTTIQLGYNVTNNNFGLTYCNLTIDGSQTGDTTGELLGTGSEEFYDFNYTFSIGTHTWSVLCYDSFGKINTTDTRTINIIDDQAPVVSYISPAEGANLNTQTFDVTFNATDSNTPVLDCDVFDQSLNLLGNNASVNSGEITTMSVTAVNEGDNVLNITCNDGTNDGSYQMAGFISVIWIPPATKLMYPPDEHIQINDQDVRIWFNSTVKFGNVYDCNLYVNDQNVLENPYIDIGNDAEQVWDFNYTFPFGSHTWFVNCTDSFNNTNVSETRDINILTFGVSLLSPNNQSTITDTTPDFNFISVGSFSEYSCELYLDSELKYTNHTVQNATATIFAINETLSLGWYDWNVTCNNTFSGTSSFFIGEVQLPAQGIVNWGLMFSNHLGQFATIYIIFGIVFLVGSGVAALKFFGGK